MVKHMAYKLKRLFALLLALLMTTAILPSKALADSGYSGHWAENSINRALQAGWFTDGGDIRPNDSITRAEFVTMINRMKGYTGSADLSGFSDVQMSDWYYGEFSTAVANGYMQGNAGKLNPLQPITRNEAITIFTNISGLDTSEDSSAALAGVRDAASIPEWVRPHAGAAVRAGLIAGSNGKLNGNKRISRAETAELLVRLHDDIHTYGFPGTYTGDAKSVVIAVPDVTLQNANISGDLTISAGVGDGEVYLNTVTVGGKLDVQGGGMNSINITDSDIETIIITKDGVNVVFSDGTTATYAYVDGSDSSIVIQSGASIGNIIVEEDAANINVTVEGNATVDSITVEGAGASIEMADDATVNTLNLADTAEGASITTASGSTIGTVNISAKDAKLIGSGTIKNANINASGVVIESKPEKTVVSSGLTANVAGAVVGGSSGSSSSSGNNTGGNGPSNPGPSNPGPSNPDPGNPDPGNPDPGNPDPGNPDPGNPDPGNPDPGNPDPGNPDPGNPDPGNPDPGNPDPGNPDPDDTLYSLALGAQSGGSIYGSSGSYASGAEIHLVAVPLSGYEFVRWTATNGTFSNDIEAETNFVMPSGDCTVSASFEVLPSIGSGGAQISRGLWIAKLVEAAKLSMFNTSVTSSFADIQVNHQYLQAIEIALQNGVIACEDKTTAFSPDENATEQFAAMTAVKALGYSGTDAECYQIAVSVRLMSSAPSINNISADAAEKLLLNVRASVRSTMVPSTPPPPVVELSEDVTELKNEDLGDEGYTYETAIAPNMFLSGFSAQQNATAYVTMPKNESTRLLKIGDCILLPANEDFPGGLAQKIVSIEDKGTAFKFGTVVPSYEEFMAGGLIQAKGEAVIETSSFEADPNLGSYGLSISPAYQPIAPRAMGIAPTALPGSVLKVTFSQTGDNYKAVGYLDITMPNIEYIIDLDYSDLVGIPTGVNELYVGLKNEIVLYGDLNISTTIIDNVRLGRCTVPLGSSGFTAIIDLYANLTVDGKIEIDYRISLTSGIQYKHSQLRTISSTSSTTTFIPLEVTLKGGLSIRTAIALFGVFDLADVNVDAGLGARGTLEYRTDPAVCVDCIGYVYLDINALSDSTVAGVLLDGPYSWNIWTESNSPFKKSLHFEGTEEHIGVVGECTFGQGDLKAVVRDSLTNSLIASFTAKIEKTSGDSYQSTIDVTGADGVLSVENLNSGDYKLTISKQNYQDYSCSFRIVKDQVTNLGTIRLVGGGTGSGSGTVREQMGNPVHGATVALHAANGSPISSVTTDGNGAFSFSGANGYYTIKVTMIGYPEVEQAFIMMTEGADGQDVVLAQDDGDLRIVLTWGATPSDLDSHLCGPTVTGTGRFHVYYSYKAYAYEGETHAFLDYDDTTSYGPETTTVYNINPSGNYSFYIHDYSNIGSAGSTAMAASGAIVRVYAGGSQIGTFHVPSAAGTLWHVFDYNAGTGTLTPRNTVTSYTGSTGGIGVTGFLLDANEFGGDELGEGEFGEDELGEGELGEGGIDRPDSVIAEDWFDQLDEEQKEDIRNIIDSITDKE